MTTLLCNYHQQDGLFASQVCPQCGCRDCSVVDNCHDNATCTTVNNWSTCICDEGYVGNGNVCAPKECYTEEDCPNHSTCQDYICIADHGYTRNGVVFEDIDECIDTDICDPNATCHNIEGGFECECNNGFEASGFECLDVDECQDVAVCGEVAVCEKHLVDFPVFVLQMNLVLHEVLMD
eukprot:UN29333